MIVLALPPKDETEYLLFGYENYDIEGWPVNGDYDVWVTDSEGNEYRIGKVELPTEVRPHAIDWIDSPPDQRFCVGVTVLNRKTGDVYFIRAVKVSGRLVLWYHGKPRIRNADPANWRVVEVS